MAFAWKKQRNKTYKYRRLILIPYTFNSFISYLNRISQVGHYLRYHDSDYLYILFVVQKNKSFYICGYISSIKKDLQIDFIIFWMKKSLSQKRKGFVF